MRLDGSPDLPRIDGRESFDDLVRKLSVYFVQNVDAPHSWEDLRNVVYARMLKPLVTYLANETEHPAVVSALLALKSHFANCEANDDRGISQTRGLACELAAWRYVTHLTESEAIDVLCHELPIAARRETTESPCHDLNNAAEEGTLIETAPLLDGAIHEADQSFADEGPETSTPSDSMSFATTFAGLNALEIAAVADAKKFMSQRAIQRVIDGIWKGDIVFWETLGQHSTKQAKFYNKTRSDPFCRLRVPLYLKAFEVLFFAAFLVFYYIVLLQKTTHTVSAAEVMLYVWLTAFAYNELAEFWDAGSTFYAVDFWSLWDVGIIATGIAFLVVRVLGLSRNDHQLTDTAFDILSVEALFLVPRICSLLSLHPYFGTLLPCLKEMTKDFIKFLGLVAILYVGFDTCFAFLARGTYSPLKMNWILIKVFFGSSYLGFDVADQISPILGPPLMFIFVCLTNILLITSLISLLSNTLTKVVEHAREEYLSVYAVYVLEASTSNRLVYFIPPLNLLALLLRPLRLVVSAERLRSARIVLLKATHWPFVALIMIWEKGQRLYWQRDAKHFPSAHALAKGPTAAGAPSRPLYRHSYRRALLPRGLPGPREVEQPKESDTSPGAQGTVSVETVEELKKAILKLTSQVENLSSMMRQQNGAKDGRE
ncbi:hypothetical protein BAUCODRAFT_152304 [Baudoinia panamericana UAMH 10762]|uniref:Calcium channel YVC1-like C-terminal transmembrane domain-containing protein n=1 Tax=Baudoinia panamericana (strain UAMH 10762) TaxID=717646 RepID=M2M5P2_BAUPA|nr:uncharacterized protein BAUCODRAFT_152304 [Baudoinia panamericana UAMH 10762]EMC91951.1 hypothetical protein BAUCODRAFT_152304 [Baudoinia panamericana UAMH 10762]